MSVASLPPAAEKSLAIEVLSKTEPISCLAAQHQVSRSSSTNRGIANEALDATFAATDEREVPSPAHHQDLVISIDFGINLVCHCSYRGVELLRICSTCQLCRNDSPSSQR